MTNPDKLLIPQKVEELLRIRQPMKLQNLNFDWVPKLQI